MLSSRASVMTSAASWFACPCGVCVVWSPMLMAQSTSVYRLHSWLLLDVAAWVHSTDVQELHDQWFALVAIHSERSLQRW